MKPTIAQCPCGELFLMTRSDYEGFQLCPACYVVFREDIYVAEHTWKPYRPSNGTEGMHFQAAYCDNCHYQGNPESGKGCMILLRTMLHDIGDPEYPQEWQQNEIGEAICLKHKTREQYRKEHPINRINKDQLFLL